MKNTMFVMLYALVCAENAEQVMKAKGYLNPATYEGANNCLQKWSTVTRWKQYQNGTINREQATKYACKRIDNAYNKYLVNDASKLDTAAAAPDISSISIHVHWSRNSVWGWNPTATVTTYSVTGGRTVTTGHASGCGYDKLSAAVANALNNNPGILKALYMVKEQALKEGYAPEPGANYSNAKCIAYGAGYGAIPYYEGGVGINSTLDTLKKCGFTLVTSDRSGKHDDYFYLEVSSK